MLYFGDYKESDLADLVLSGLRTPIREKLEGYEFLNINQVLQRALAHESRSKDLKEVHRYLCHLRPNPLLAMI